MSYEPNAFVGLAKGRMQEEKIPKSEANNSTKNSYLGISSDKEKIREMT